MINTENKFELEVGIVIGVLVGLLIVSLYVLGNPSPEHFHPVFIQGGHGGNVYNYNINVDCQKTMLPVDGNWTIYPVGKPIACYNGTEWCLNMSLSNNDSLNKFKDVDGI